MSWKICEIVNAFNYIFHCLSGGEAGSADTARDPRGFAVKMYTEEGNWDLVGNNTPIFFIRDPMMVSYLRLFDFRSSLTWLLSIGL